MTLLRHIKNPSPVVFHFIAFYAIQLPIPYIKAFRKRKQLSLPLRSEIRFHNYYFLNDNSYWKKNDFNKNSQDYSTVLEISKKLFFENKKVLID